MEPSRLPDDTGGRFQSITIKDKENTKEFFCYKNCWNTCLNLSCVDNARMYDPYLRAVSQNIVHVGGMKYSHSPDNMLSGFEGL